MKNDELNTITIMNNARQDKKQFDLRFDIQEVPTKAQSIRPLKEY